MANASKENKGKEEIKVVTNEELIKDYGFTQEDVDSMMEAADCYDRGEWPPGRVVWIGRPPFFEERMKSVTFRETELTIMLMDAKASAMNMSRSEYLRDLVRKDLDIA